MVLKCVQYLCIRHEAFAQNFFLSIRHIANKQRLSAYKVHIILLSDPRPYLRVSTAVHLALLPCMKKNEPRIFIKEERATYANTHLTWLLLWSYYGSQWSDDRCTLAWNTQGHLHTRLLKFKYMVMKAELVKSVYVVSMPTSCFLFWLVDLIMGSSKPALPNIKYFRGLQVKMSKLIFHDTCDRYYVISSTD